MTDHCSTASSVYLMARRFADAAFNQTEIARVYRAGSPEKARVLARRAVGYMVRSPEYRYRKGTL